MKTTPTPTAAAQEYGALARNGVASYLTWAAKDASAVALLLKLFCKRKDGAESDAIWSGHCALRSQVNGYIAKLRDCGGLLFFGQPAALHAARALNAAQEGVAA